MRDRSHPPRTGEVFRTRDLTPREGDDDGVWRRFRSMGEAEQVADDGKIRILASTSDPVDWGGWREVLVHQDGAIDTSAARSLLINHKADQLAGGIAGFEVANRELTCVAEIDPDARMQSGVNVKKSVAKRTLNGVSIGYTYRFEDTIYDEDTRTVTVLRWRLLEISLTPIPADARAQVRSLPAKFPAVPTPTRAAAPEGANMTFEAWLKARGLDQTKMTEAEVAKARAIHGAGGELPEGFAAHARAAVATPAPVAAPAPAAPVAAPVVPEATAPSEAQRAAIVAEQRDIAQQAKSVGLDASEFVGLTRSEAQVAMLRKLAASGATAAPAQTPAPAMVTRDQMDKSRDAFTGALASLAGVRNAAFDKLREQNPLNGRGLLGAIRGYARLQGIDASGWEKEDVAWFALGRHEMMSDSAQRSVRASNTGTGQFPNFVFLNAITKIVATGFEMGSATARYRRIVETQRVPDFKQFSIGSLSVGNLQKTAELAVFPELDKAEGVYNSAVNMWGGTLSLSMQALVSDDTSQFARKLRAAGSIADKTIDRRVFQKLLMGTSAAEGTSTWTSNTTSGGSLVYTTADLGAAARGKLALVRAALANKVGKDGNPVGTIPRFLICGPTREIEAQAIVGGSGPLLAAGQPQPAASMEVIATPWLEASALTGYSATSYYLLADPLEVTGLLLSYVNGFDTVQVMPYDAGAVAGFNWKMFLPFEADLFYETVGSTKTIYAAQQGTT